MSDLIYRQAAIEAVTPFDDEYRIRDAIEDLPSAQPEDIQKIQDLEQAQFSKIRELLIKKARLMLCGGFRAVRGCRKKTVDVLQQILIGVHLRWILMYG